MSAVLVGAGVVDHRAALARFAERAGVAVVNTERAKGVFAWNDPHHGGTVGLQARDLVLAGATDGEGRVRPGVVVCGLGDEELVGLDRRRCRVVAPGDLDELAVDGAEVPETEVRRPPLYERIAAVVGPAYDDATTPPARAAALAERAAASDAVIVAGGDLAGFWIGRTLPTRAPGTVDLGPEPVSQRVAAHRKAGRRVLVVHATGASPVDPDDGAEVIRWEPANLAGALLDHLVDVAGPITPRYRGPER